MGFVDNSGLKRVLSKIKTLIDSVQNTADAAKDSIDNLEIGGRNMLRGSSFKGLAQVDNTYTKYKNNSVKLVCDNTSGTSTKYVTISSLQQSWDLADVVGRTITISMWIYIEKVGQLNGYEFRIVFTHNGVVYWLDPDKRYSYYIPSASSLKQGWNYVYGSFSIPEDSTLADFNFTCYASPGQSSTAWFSSPKAEIGTRPSQWTPAPEDIDNDINNAKLYADTQDSKLKSLIDGKASSSHNHDDRYYTEAEVDSRLSSKMSAKGSNDMWGLTAPNGNDDIYVKAPLRGIIPYSDKSSNTSGKTYYLGTPAWPWSVVYADNFIGSLNGNAATATKATSADTVPSITNTELDTLLTNAFK